MTITASPRTRREARTAQVAQSGRVIACWGVAASGKSSIALNLAYQLARGGSRVLLVDADTHSPALATALALSEHPAGLAPMLRFARQQRLTEIEFAAQSVVVRFGKAKFCLVPGITPTRWPEVTPAAFTQFLAYASERFDQIVVDLATPLESELYGPSGPMARNDFTRWMLASAQQVLVCLSADPVSIARFLQLEPQLAELRGGPETVVIVNNFRERAIGAGAKNEISRTIKALTGRKVSLFVKHRPKLFDDALRAGSPIGLSKAFSQAGLALAKLVSWPHLPSSSSKPRQRRSTSTG